MSPIKSRRLIRPSLVPVAGRVGLRISTQLDKCPSGPLRVTSDKAHVKHNESALPLIADIPGDVAFRCQGPEAPSNRI